MTSSLQVVEKNGKRYIDDPEEGLLEVRYGLPAEVKYCKRCVISNQRPSSVVEFHNRLEKIKPVIAFDEEGVCAACRYADIKEEIDWKRREAELIALCDKYRSRNGHYDCIVPGSGGKDSCFASHVLKYKYGMNPLTVTWSPHKYTEIGWKNFQNWIHVGGLDNVLVTPNGRVHSLLTRLAFTNLCHPFQPFIIGQRMAGARQSALYNVPLVFYGENAAEYGNAIKDNEKPTMDMSFFERSVSVENLTLSGFPVADLIKQEKLTLADLNPYLPVPYADLQRVGTEVHYLGYYLRWDPQEMYYYAVEHCGFAANTERTEGTYSKYNSLDDQIDPLHYYTTLIKFGIGRTTYDAAQEIRNRKIDRTEGIALVRRFDTEVPRKYLPSMLEYLGLSEDQFWDVIEKFRSPHLWRKKGNAWELRHPIQENI